MPVIHLEKCTSCLKCVRDCPANAIHIKTGFIDETCIHCGHCVAICPELAVSPDHGLIYPLNPHSVTPEEFIKLSAGIRSCRSYQSREVPEEILLQLVENMKHYPSASNARPLKITLVRSAGLMQQLNDSTEDALVRMISLVTSPWLSPLIGIFAKSLDVKKLKKYKESFLSRKSGNNSLICHHAPVAMLFHGPVTKTGMLEADANIWATYTSLYANTLGLATCFNGFIVKAMATNNRMNSEFGVPKGHRVYAALLIGYPKVRYVSEVSRQSPEVTLI